jgi:hypothetical protein
MKDNEVLWKFVRELEERVRKLEGEHEFRAERLLVGCQFCGGAHWEGEGCPGEVRDETNPES